MKICIIIRIGFLKVLILANLIQENLIEYTGAKNLGAKGSSFAVIRESEMPATLLELGFISNSSERQKLVQILIKIN